MTGLLVTKTIIYAQQVADHLREIRSIYNNGNKHNCQIIAMAQTTPQVVTSLCHRLLCSGHAAAPCAGAHAAAANANLYAPCSALHGTWCCWHLLLLLAATVAACNCQRPGDSPVTVCSASCCPGCAGLWRARASCLHRRSSTAAATRLGQSQPAHSAHVFVVRQHAGQPNPCDVFPTTWRLQALHNSTLPPPHWQP